MSGSIGIVRLSGKELAALRLACMKRDGWRCSECDRPVTDAVPEWHPSRAHMAHIVGRGRGGSDTLDNLRCLCGRCHLEEEHNPKSVRRK